eukprot:gnl/MRDRNA2_/MRDRNA2_72831_c0_seq1.p1 gnl/MRDRNA2_/MRDRNA2_72831_c0~~gnl/MRDRNA2_/MRDRNA2_72831_c0_seq1.p1  ORF type:complete len:852 (-),score=142.18 gnl/MRDRNA2_/MRDRNA2_72831_c0_seq1:62-2617(-)
MIQLDVSDLCAGDGFKGNARQGTDGMIQLDVSDLSASDGIKGNANQGEYHGSTDAESQAKAFQSGNEVRDAPHAWSMPVSSKLLPVVNLDETLTEHGEPTGVSPYPPTSMGPVGFASSVALSPPPAAQGITYADDESELIDIPLANLVTDQTRIAELSKQEGFGNALHSEPIEEQGGVAFKQDGAQPHSQEPPQPLQNDFPMDPLVISSHPYFRETQRQSPPRAKNDHSAVPAATLPRGNAAFPQPRGSVVQSKITAVSTEVDALHDEVSQIIDGRSVRPAELQRLLQDADSLRASINLRDHELADVPSWPSEALRQVKAVAKAIDSWESSMAVAQQYQQLLATRHETAQACETVHLDQIVKQLMCICDAWEALQLSMQRKLNIELNLEQRARVASPMVSVLLDEALLMARADSSNRAAGQLRQMLADQRYRKFLQSLDVALPGASTVMDLQSSECMKQTAPKRRVQCVVATDVLWKAIVQGDVPVITALAKQAVLPSGQATLDQKVTVFWNALELQQLEVSYCLMQLFPPSDSTGRGVDVLEVHPETGNTVLHMICSCDRFTHQTAELFQAIFTVTPASHRTFLNIRGETFLHIAARRLNFWILQFAVSQGLPKDVATGELTPLMQVEMAIRQRKGPLVVPNKPGRLLSNVPSWFQLAKLAPTRVGDKPAPFHDVTVELQDSKLGIVAMHAHSVVLAGTSPVIRSLISDTASGDGQSSLRILKIEPQYCSSSQVLFTALKFLYAGEFCCDFEEDGSLLWQLLCLCLKYQLPQPLRQCALLSTLRALTLTRNAAVVGVLLRGAQQIGLHPQEQQFVARCFACTSKAYLAVEEAKRVKTLQIALALLEKSVM